MENKTIDAKHKYVINCIVMENSRCYTKKGPYILKFNKSFALCEIFVETFSDVILIIGIIFNNIYIYNIFQTYSVYYVFENKSTYNTVAPVSVIFIKWQHFILIFV